MRIYNVRNGRRAGINMMAMSYRYFAGIRAFDIAVRFNNQMHFVNSRLGWGRQCHFDLIRERLSQLHAKKEHAVTVVDKSSTRFGRERRSCLSSDTR